MAQTPLNTPVSPRTVSRELQKMLGQSGCIPAVPRGCPHQLQRDPSAHPSRSSTTHPARPRRCCLHCCLHPGEHPPSSSSSSSSAPQGLQDAGLRLEPRGRASTALPARSPLPPSGGSRRCRWTPPTSVPPAPGAGATPVTVHPGFGTPTPGTVHPESGIPPPVPPAAWVPAGRPYRGTVEPRERRARL